MRLKARRFNELTDVQRMRVVLNPALAPPKFANVRRWWAREPFIGLTFTQWEPSSTHSTVVTISH